MVKVVLVKDGVLFELPFLLQSMSDLLGRLARRRLGSSDLYFIRRVTRGHVRYQQIHVLSVVAVQCQLSVFDVLAVLVLGRRVKVHGYG